jgi:hypothetical protein
LSDIEIRDGRAAGRLEAFGRDRGGDVVGHIEYVVLASPGPALAPVHTLVEPAHEGRGIAGAPAHDGVPVAPLYPYVARWAARHPDEAPAADPELLRAAREWLAADPERF